MQMIENGFNFMLGAFLFGLSLVAGIIGLVLVAGWVLIKIEDYRWRRAIERKTRELRSEQRLD